MIEEFRKLGIENTKRLYNEQNIDVAQKDRKFDELSLAKAYILNNICETIPRLIELGNSTVAKLKCGTIEIVCSSSIYIILNRLLNDTPYRNVKLLYDPTLKPSDRNITIFANGYTPEDYNRIKKTNFFTIEITNKNLELLTN